MRLILILWIWMGLKIVNLLDMCFLMLYLYNVESNKQKQIKSFNKMYKITNINGSVVLSGWYSLLDVMLYCDVNNIKLNSVSHIGYSLVGVVEILDISLLSGSFSISNL